MKMKSFLAFAALVNATPLQSAEVTFLGINGQGVEFFGISGNFEEGDAEKFLAVTDSASDAMIFFRSEGGDLQTGLDIGSQIRMRGYSTAVTDADACYSACALAWLGGNERTIGYGALVSFHAAYVIEDGRARESGSGNALVGAYLSKLGLNQDAVVFLTSAPPDDFNELDPSWAKSLGISVNFSSTHDLVEGVQDPEAPIDTGPSSKLIWEELTSDQIDDILAVAQNGDFRAQWNAGFLYLTGRNTNLPKNIEKAVYWLSKAAEQGHTNSQMNLYALYRDGESVPTDLELARKWLMAAVEGGEKRAEVELAQNFMFGGAFERDDAKAVTVLKRLADRGDEWAQYNLAISFQNGLGVPVDEKAAADLFKKSAKAGNSSAQFELAKSYMDAKGVPVDYAEAAAWMKRAAEQNHGEAQFYLSEMYRKGQGLPKEPAMAAKWMSAAAVNGIEYANYWVALNFSGAYGVEKNDRNAASFILKFLRSRELRIGERQLTASEFVNENRRDWTPDTVAALQAALAQEGYYQKTIDGSWGPSTVAAINAFYKANR